VSDDPWWQLLFAATGMQDEIPPTAFLQTGDDVPLTPPVKPKEPPPMDKPSPPKEQEAPKRAQSCRPAQFGSAKPEEPFLKAPSKKEPSKKEPQQAEVVTDMVELEVLSDED